MATEQGTHTEVTPAADARLDGRSQEIQRLIGRAMRAAVDLQKLG